MFNATDWRELHNSWNMALFYLVNAVQLAKLYCVVLSVVNIVLFPQNYNYTHLTFSPIVKTNL